MKLAFFTGARSEYGIVKKLMRTISCDDFFDVSIIVGGMHLLKEYGYTITEIENDNFPIAAKIPIFEEEVKPDFSHFTKAIQNISSHFLQNSYDAIFIVGDRFEAYAAALAAHFAKIPLIHSGGGTITRGAFDNIYRYNITNLSTYHFATSKGNYERLLSLPVLQKENIYFTGSVAIDSIKGFLSKSTGSVEEVIPGLKPNQFVLITFHPVTNANEPIPQILEHTVSNILKNGYQVLITYPNNDPGANKIIKTIQKLNSNSNIFVTESLGANGYYSALRDCKFVLGNSSSGIIEAPYFNKYVINVGTRQDGREKDNGIFDVSAEKNLVENAIQNVLKENFRNVECNNIYGYGNSIPKIMKILKTNFS